MDRPVLIVIDMQESFPAALRPETIKNCQSLIKDAVDKNNPILFLEYEYNPSTLKELTSLTSKYSFVNTIRKITDGGSDNIEQFFFRCRIKPKNIIICGVNTDMCVYETVHGLAHSRANYNITVVNKACNTPSIVGHIQAIDSMKKLRVRVI